MGKFLSSTLADQAGYLSPDGYSLSVVVRYGALVGLAGHLGFIFLFWSLGVPAMACLNVVSCAVFLTCYVINQRGYEHQAMLLGGAEVIGHAILATGCLGWESSFHYYMLGLAPLIFYSRAWRTRYKALLVVLLGAIYIALYLYTTQAAPWHFETPAHLHWVSMLNMATLFVVFSIVAHFYRAAATHAEEALVHANQKLEYLAHTDPLTRLLNRRNMMMNLETAVDTFFFTGQPFSVILGDIDHFKTVNDRYGHEAGDLILVEVAETLRGCVREQDHVARWGGEEFLVLMPGAYQDSAQQAAERLRECIASPRMRFGETESRITMTFGVSTFCGRAEINECIRCADQAMYQGKRQGRNCVVVYEDNLDSAAEFVIETRVAGAG